MGIIQFIIQFSQFGNPNTWAPMFKYGFNVKNPFETPNDYLLPHRIPFLNNYGLMPNLDGSICFSRSVTTFRPEAGTEAADYFDMQDWQVLYDYRANCYAISQAQQYVQAKGSVQTAAALNSEFLKIAGDFETLEMLQNVKELAGQFIFTRSLANRAAFIFQAPVNVIPGFINKGIAIFGTTQFDSLVA